MPFRIREILLVSSAYDAFVLEEDGALTDQLYSEYSELNLSQTPRITHVDSKASALKMLEGRHFDLVITVIRIGTTDAGDLSAQIKKLYPRMPIGLLVFDETDLRYFPNSQSPSTVDRTFLWTGDASILIAAIKLIEDKLNVFHDTREVGVRVILVVEDTLKFYSSFLAKLYRELMMHSQSLIAEGLNENHRLLRMRARPKILLAHTYEEAMDIIETHKDYLMGLITDLRFPVGGQTEKCAGLRLVNNIRAYDDTFPVLVQSSEITHAIREKLTDITLLEKNSPRFHRTVRKFLEDELGFGEFHFRLPSGETVGRARDTYEMTDFIQSLPAESLRHHGSRDHFSSWLNARSMFALASTVRDMKIEDFANIEESRQFLLNVLLEAQRNHQEGVVTDFAPHHTGPHNRFVKLGKGSIGGKGRGIAYMSTLIVQDNLIDQFPGLQVRIPKTIVIGTEEFDEFISRINKTTDLSQLSDIEITKFFLEYKLRPSLLRDLWTSFLALKGPLAVRSSSLLEDSRFAPFAGVYATYMLPNNHPDPMERFDELCRAIVAVYSSTRWSDAKRYIANTPHLLEDEKMAVVIQQVVGREYGTRYYPHFSGVAKSHSYYAIGEQKPEDGVAEMSVGLGEMVVSGGRSARFAPGAPKLGHQFRSAKEQFQNSQSHFYSLDLSKHQIDLNASPKTSLSLKPLQEALEDKTLNISVSVFSAADDVIREQAILNGPLVVTFNNILKWDAIPLPEALKNVLDILKTRMSSDIEIEFAVDMGDWGKHIRRGQKRTTPKLYILQVRPMTHHESIQNRAEFENVLPDQVFCETNNALGNGRFENLRDIIFVDINKLDGLATPQIANIVGNLNEKLKDQGKKFILIGPGRWGTSDSELGVPTTWRQLSEAKVIIETAIDGRFIEPSQGSHFFHNVVAMDIGYLTVFEENSNVLDLNWLRTQKVIEFEGPVKHIQLEHSLNVLVDGVSSSATILKPEKPDDES